MVVRSGFLAPTANVIQEEFDPVLETTLAFEETARELDLEGEILQRLRHPERELTVQLPLRVGSGPVIGFTGFRVQHSTARGPGLGPVCLGPSLSLTQIKARAMSLTWQCALLDLPFGGAAGAIVCDPARLSEADLERLVRSYTHGLRGFIGPFCDVLTPDADMNPRVMAWMADGYAQVSGHLEPGAFAGKPLAIGGLSGELAARYLCFLLREILGTPALAGSRRESLQGLRIAVEGFGTVGMSLAAVVSALGVRVVAVSDISGGLHDERGLDIADVSAFAVKNRVLFGYRQAEAMTLPELLGVPCDVFILTEAERAITVQNAGQVKAGIVVEAAPSALTASAAGELEARNVVVIPELLAGAGHVLHAFLEWSKSVRSCHWTLAELDTQLQSRVQSALHEVTATCGARSTRPRHACHLLGVGRVAEALRVRS